MQAKSGDILMIGGGEGVHCAASAFCSGVGKMIIAVNEDIQPQNLDMVFWAICRTG
jgi:3-polyprenyl-4-hydroxybenzoate decarboxylase